MTDVVMQALIKKNEELEAIIEMDKGLIESYSKSITENIETIEDLKKQIKEKDDQIKEQEELLDKLEDMRQIARDKAAEIVDELYI